jgi:hypothetical protein
LIVLDPSTPDARAQPVGDLANQRGISTWISFFGEEIA